MTFIRIVPIGIFLIFASVLYLSLDGTDPSKLPSQLEGQKAPKLPESMGSSDFESSATSLSFSDLKKDQFALVNFWASWCAPCKIEHPILMSLAKDERFVLYGINYKDKESAARDFLAELGNPFDRLLSDNEGRAAIDWGVYGVPETFLVDQNGTVLLRHVGPLTEDALERNFLPLVQIGTTEFTDSK